MGITISIIFYNLKWHVFLYFQKYLHSKYKYKSTISQMFVFIFLCFNVLHTSMYQGRFWLGQKKKICVFTVTCQKNLGSIDRHYSFFSKLSSKPEIVVPGSGIQYLIFGIRYLIFGKPSFVLWRVTQLFYLLCSQFRQKASGWINKTLLLVKQQKWLSEFCVKIDRVVSKN